MPDCYKIKLKNAGYQLGLPSWRQPHYRDCCGCWQAGKPCRLPGIRKKSKRV